MKLDACFTAACMNLSMAQQSESFLKRAASFKCSVEDGKCDHIILLWIKEVKNEGNKIANGLNLK